MIRHENLLSSGNCLLMIIDVQQAFVPHVFEFERMAERCRIMIEAAQLLDVPLLVTEQYPQGLGRTVPELSDVLPDTHYYDKITFSCCQDESINNAIAAARRKQILMVGIETHVCILQTALDLLNANLQPYLAADALSSRRPSDHDIALRRLRRAGAIVTTTETAIMEMTFSSQHKNFRAISKLIK